MKKKLIGILLATTLVAIVFAGCTGENENIDKKVVKIIDAYCDNQGHFNFTLINRLDEEIIIEYSWTLNDPRADHPILLGNGKVTLVANEEKDIVTELNESLCIDEEHIEFYKEYDSRFYIMYIEIEHQDEIVYQYNQQKSTYDWDYSLLPPEEK